MRLPLIPALLLLAGILDAATSEWPNWRGPAGNGSSPATGLPARLDPQADALWTVTLPGAGAGTPVVSDGRIFLTIAEKQTHAIQALAIDATDGRIVWQRALGTAKDAGKAEHLVQSSAVTDGKRVWFNAGSDILVACTVDGQELWRRGLDQAHGAWSNKFGFGTSPLLYRNRLYLQALSLKAKPSFVIAVDPDTGKDLLKVERPSTAVEESQDSYSTPIPGPNGDRPSVIIAGADLITAYDADTLKERWRFAFDPKRDKYWRLIPTPVCQDGLVIASVGRGTVWYGLKDDGQGDITTTGIAWQSDAGGTDTPTPAIWQGDLFAISSGKKPALYRRDPRTGAVKGQVELAGEFYASPTLADGKAYCLSTNGTAWVIDVATMQVLARTELGGRKDAASIVPIDGRIFVRTGVTLRAFGRR